MPALQLAVCPNNAEVHIYKASPDSDPATWERLHVLKEHDQARWHRMRSPPTSPHVGLHTPSCGRRWGRGRLTGGRQLPAQPTGTHHGCAPKSTPRLTASAPPQVVSALDWAPSSNMLLSASHDRNIYVWTVRKTVASLSRQPAA